MPSLLKGKRIISLPGRQGLCKLISLVLQFEGMQTHRSLCFCCSKRNPGSASPLAPRAGAAAGSTHGRARSAAVSTGTRRRSALTLLHRSHGKGRARGPPARRCGGASPRLQPTDKGSNAGAALRPAPASPQSPEPRTHLRSPAALRTPRPPVTAPGAAVTLRPSGRPGPLRARAPL